MSDATESAEMKTSAATKSGTTIRPEEAAHFGQLAREWWDPKGSSAMLHKLNPVRLGFVREAVDLHWGGDTQSVRPLAGKSVLDVGCGAGLLCEPLARLGGDVTGVDAAPENVQAAIEHASGNGLLAPLPTGEGLGVGGATSANVEHPSPTPSLEGRGSVRYMTGEIGSLDIGRFDLVTSMEVIEHVADKRAFVSALAQRLAPGGLMVLSTPNRTAASRLLLVGAAETVGMVPRGTHHWDDFATPEELEALLAEAGLEVTARQGIGFSLSKGLHLSGDESLNYILSARFR